MVWAARPSDLLWCGVAAAGQEEILRGAGLACSAWRRAARDEPALWRRIDLHSDVAAHAADSSFSDDDDDDDDDDAGDPDGYSVPVDDGSSDALVEESDSDDAENNGDDAASVQSNRSSDDFFGFSDAFVEESDDDDDDVPRKESADYKYEPKGWKEMARAAVDRSAGECVAFWGRADDKLLLYLSDRYLIFLTVHLIENYTDTSSVSQCKTCSIAHIHILPPFQVIRLYSIVHIYIDVNEFRHTYISRFINKYMIVR